MSRETEAPGHDDNYLGGVGAKLEEVELPVCGLVLKLLNLAAVLLELLNNNVFVYISYLPQKPAYLKEKWFNVIVFVLAKV
jgi:hypothetical protein